MMQFKSAQVDLIKPNRSWTQIVQDDVVGRLEDNHTDQLINSFIRQMDNEDLMERSSNSDRTYAKLLCYTYSATIKFKRELPSYIRQYGEWGGRATLESHYSSLYPWINFKEV